MTKVLMVKIGNATFVERDEKILSELYSIRVFQFGTRSWKFIWSAVKFWGWILRYIWSSDLLFTRFAHYHAFLLGLASKIFRKKLAIVIGGSDAVWIPRYGYGVYDNWLSRRTTRLALKMASLLLPNHASLVKGVNRYSDDAPRPEGLLEYNPDLTTRMITVHNGYDVAYWHRLSEISREEVVVTVALTYDYKVFVTKGLDYYIRTAAELPQYRFYLVGLTAQTLRQWWMEQIPANVVLTPGTTVDELRKLYSRATVFAHFTLTEGMPNVLCEAMLCECVPVGSDVNSLPDIIGDAGFLVRRRNVYDMKSAVEQAMHSDLGMRARQRIVENFPLEKRKRELTRALDELLNSDR